MTMTSAKLNRIKNPKATVKPAEDVTWAEARQFFLDLRAWGEWKGFKPGYAAVQYKERFGVWPLRKWNDERSADNVGSETMAYIENRKKEWSRECKKARKIEEQRKAEMGEMVTTRRNDVADDWIDLGDYQ